MGAPQVEGLGQKLGQTEMKTAKGTEAAAELASQRFETVVNAAARALDKGEPPARPHLFFVNRVIGLPGERIQFSDSRILVNGKPLRIPKKLAKGYSALKGSEKVAFGATEYTVPANSIFVLNDNLDGTTDSRHIGAISLDAVVGRVVT